MAWPQRSHLLTYSMNISQYGNLGIVGWRKEVKSRSIQSKDIRIDVQSQTKIEITAKERIPMSGRSCTNVAETCNPSSQYRYEN